MVFEPADHTKPELVLKQDNEKCGGSGASAASSTVYEHRQKHESFKIRPGLQNHCSFCAFGGLLFGNAALPKQP